MTEEGYHEGVLTMRRAAAAALCGEGSLTMSSCVLCVRFSRTVHAVTPVAASDAAGVAGGYAGVGQRSQIKPAARFTIPPRSASRALAAGGLGPSGDRSETGRRGPTALGRAIHDVEPGGRSSPNYSVRWLSPLRCQFSGEAAPGQRWLFRRHRLFRRQRSSVDTVRFGEMRVGRLPTGHR